MPEVLIGEVNHYFPRIGVAGLELKLSLHRGDLIHIQGHTTNLEETVESMEIDHHKVEVAHAGDDVAVKTLEKVRPGDKVYLEFDGNAPDGLWET